MEVILTNENFDAEVISSEIPVLVDFYADWCGPCKMMAPIVANIAESYEGKLKVCKCNIDEAEGIAVRFRVMSIPTIKLFKGGKEAMTSIGAISQKELEDKISEAL